MAAQNGKSLPPQLRPSSQCWNGSARVRVVANSFRLETAVGVVDADDSVKMVVRIEVVGNCGEIVGVGPRRSVKTAQRIEGMLFDGVGSAETRRERANDATVIVVLRDQMSPGAGLRTLSLAGDVDSRLDMSDRGVEGARCWHAPTPAAGAPPPGGMAQPYCPATVIVPSRSCTAWSMSAVRRKTKMRRSRGDRHDRRSCEERHGSAV